MLTRNMIVAGECYAPEALIANIPDSQRSVSGFYDNDPCCTYSRSRLHTQFNDDGNDGEGAWAADENRVGEYIQADFGQLQRIQAIATQGMPHGGLVWVTSYKFAYSTDGVTYHYVTRDDDGSDRVFVGNIDNDTVVEHSFDVSIVARFVRLYPQTYVSYMALRWEVYGCSYNG